MYNYWLVGATRGPVDRTNEFTESGYWELEPEGRMNTTNQNSFLQIRVNDRIAIKTLNGRSNRNMTIKAVGIITAVDTEPTRLSVSWHRTNLNRVVALKGCMRAIQKRYDTDANTAWLNEVFRI
jgi:hypothetical protein